MDDKKIYLLWINNIIIEYDDEEYDFLNEMYPEIKQLYNILWYFKRSKKTPYNQIILNKINRIKNDISIKLQILGIPEYIIVIKEDDTYIEPISGEKLNIVNNSLKLREIGSMNFKSYIDNLDCKTVDFLNEKLSDFNNILMNKELRKRKI